MNDRNLAFYGFSTDAAKKSSKISEILNRLIAGVERDIKLVTSTPKFGKRMEISFSKHYNFHVTMDHDSGYMSHHQESNSDSLLENINDTIRDPSSSRPIYLSEDALLEKPEIGIKITKLDTEKTDDEETRKFGTDFGKEDVSESNNVSTSPDTVLSTSVISQETTYSEFDDSDSNKSVEIPCTKQIIVENINNYIRDNDLQCNSIDSSLNITNGTNQEIVEKGDCIQSEIVNSSCIYPNNLVSSDYVTEYNGIENNSALNNITNTCNNTKVKENKKRLTLIFSKSNKENVYSVKRKYQSISPEKDALLEESNTENLQISGIINVESEIKDLSNLNCIENLNNTCSDAKDFNLEHDSVDLKNEIIEINKGNNRESPEKELILKNELDLDEIVLQQENTICCRVPNPQVQGGLLDMKEEKIYGPIQQNSPQTKTPIKQFENPIDPNVSPDLFENEEVVEDVKVSQPSNYIAEERYIIRKDQRILRRAQNSLKGVLPPHCVTIVQLSVDEMLNRLETNKEYFWTNTKTNEESNADTLNVSDETVVAGESKSLLVAGNEGCVYKKFPQVLSERYHGLHHNRSKLSEEFEELCMKYGQRYVGAETQSSCTIFETNFISPTKRKQTKQRWAVKSPGRRLSHLAKRRITFSSANLQAGASFMGSRARQILVDAKKLDLLNRRRSPRKSPRKNLRRTPRKTPSKSPRIKSRTPSSSAKKKLAMRFRELTGEIEKTVPITSSEKSILSSKRVLFQSPDRDMKPNIFQPSTSGLSAFENELKKPGTKRALFISPSKRSPLKKSPFKRSPFKRIDLGAEKKRKRAECDDMPPSKLARSVSMDVRPTECEMATKINRTNSDMNISLNKTQTGVVGEMSAVHKKKLQWAVYEALRSQNITPAHPQFKIFASVLARVTRRLLPNLSSNAPKECGTTERMLRISRVHVFAVIKGKSVEEIISEHLRSKARYVKPQGYIAPQDSNSDKKNLGVSRVNVVQARSDVQSSLERKKLEQLSKPKVGVESRIDRIRKVINFGDG